MKYFGEETGLATEKKRKTSDDKTLIDKIKYWKYTEAGNVVKHICKRRKSICKDDPTAFHDPKGVALWINKKYFRALIKNIPLDDEDLDTARKLKCIRWVCGFRFVFTGDRYKKQYIKLSSFRDDN